MNRGLTFGSAFKLSMVSSATVITILHLMASLSALISGESSMTFMDASLASPAGFMYGLLFLPLFIVVFGGAIATTVALGQWIYTRLFPLKLEFADPSDAANVDSELQLF